LPMRLIYMYTFAKAPEADFGGDIVLDMFNGSGSTTLAARATGRNWIGIDLNPDYCRTAEHRLLREGVDEKAILLESQKVKSAKSSKQMSFSLGEEASDYIVDN
jgi:DNA modification methylase